MKIRRITFLTYVLVITSYVGSLPLDDYYAEINLPDYLISGENYHLTDDDEESATVKSFPPSTTCTQPKSVNRNYNFNRVSVSHQTSTSTISSARMPPAVTKPSVLEIKLSAPTAPTASSTKTLLVGAVKLLGITGKSVGFIDGDNDESHPSTNTTTNGTTITATITTRPTRTVTKTTTRTTSKLTTVPEIMKAETRMASTAKVSTQSTLPTKSTTMKRSEQRSQFVKTTMPSKGSQTKSLRSPLVHLLTATLRTSMPSNGSQTVFPTSGSTKTPIRAIHVLDIFDALPYPQILKPLAVLFLLIPGVVLSLLLIFYRIYSLFGSLPFFLRR